MTQDPRSMPEGAGAEGQSTTTARVSVSGADYTPGQQSTSESGSFRQDDQYRGYSSGREVVLADRTRSKPSTAMVVGAALAGAVAGAAIPFMLRGKGSSSSGRSEDTVEESITVNRPARELYDYWRDFTNFPQFMDNIKSVKKLDEKRSHWVIKAPAGTSVEFNSRITQDEPARLIAWQSEEGASVNNRGRVEFIDQGGSTMVRTRISYEPPAGAAGRLVAKVFRREPGVQARHDLRHFKELMENGRVSS